jgi:hypothetical protein
MDDDIIDSAYEHTTNINDIIDNANALKTDEEIVLSKKKKRKVLAPYGYIAVGNGKSLKNKKEKSIDFIEAMVDMSIDERRVLNILKNHLFEDKHRFGIIRMVMSDWEKQEKKSWQNGIAALVNKDYVRRVKKGYYIINPKLLVPTGDKTIQSGLSNDEKVDRHDKYIMSVMDNWEKCINNNPLK